MLRRLVLALPALPSRQLPTAPSSVKMLHSILHKHRHWRQAGQLQCSFCSSARYADKAEDPLSQVKDNPYFDRYAEKIREKQQSSPEEFKARLREAEEQQRQAREDALKTVQEFEQKIVGDKTLTKKKKLSNILKLELIQDKTIEEITQIWNEYHSQKDVIHAVIPAEEYEEIHNRALQFPTFIYPLPRDAGYEFILQQWDGDELHFTQLIAYQAHGENAPACLNMTHYTELMKDKGIVLMVGEPDSAMLSVYESQLLALQVKLYYGMQSGLRFNLVRQFTNAPQAFRHMDLVREFENYKKDSRTAREERS